MSVAIAAIQRGAPPRPPVPAIEKVRDNLYAITGSDTSGGAQMTGGTTAVFVTERGVVLVDTKNPGYGPDILAQVKTVTDRPVVMIINTHTHGDHTGSNTAFGAEVENVVHENTRANMARMPAFSGEGAQFLAKRTFKDRLSLNSGRDRIDLYYFGRGHTNGDTFVVFPAVRAVHAGDMFQRKNIPFIDMQNNAGSPYEFASTLTAARKSLRNVDVVIPGHANRTMTWGDFSEYVDFYRDFVDQVERGMKAGRTADQIAEGYRPPEKFQDYQVDAMRVKANVEGILKERSR
jgi:glyoxylase-like metal-dependent hydrolase (beta-lactamase superfamily II)